MQQDQKTTTRPKRRPSVRSKAAKARRKIGDSRAKKLENAVDKRDRRNPHSDHAFALMAYGCGRHHVTLKPVAQVNPYSVPPVYVRHLHRYLIKLPTEHFPVRSNKASRFNFNGGDEVRNIVWSDENIMALCMQAGRQGKVNATAQNIIELYRAIDIDYGSSLAGTVADSVFSQDDGKTTALWVEVDQWDRALTSQKMFAFCQVAAQSGGQALTINLDPSVIDQAVKHPKGAASFLRDRLRDWLKPLIPKPQFAMGIDLSYKKDRSEKFHLHGVLVIPANVDPDRLRTALKSFAGQDLADTVEPSPWKDLPGGFGCYSVKASAGVAKALESRARKVGVRREQGVTFVTRGLIAQAREWWNRVRLENRATLLDLAAQDVANRP